MNRITITVPEELDDRLDGLVESGEYESKSEAVRGLIAERDESVTEYEERVSEYERRMTEYEEEIDDLESEVDRMERKLTATNERNDDVDELVEFVEDEKMRRSRSEQREEKWHDGSVWQRAKWKFTGIPLDDEDD